MQNSLNPPLPTPMNDTAWTSPLDLPLPNLPPFYPDVSCGVRQTTVKFVLIYGYVLIYGSCTRLSKETDSSGPVLAGRTHQVPKHLERILELRCIRAL